MNRCASKLRRPLYRGTTLHSNTTHTRFITQIKARNWKSGDVREDYARIRAGIPLMNDGEMSGGSSEIFPIPISLFSSKFANERTTGDAQTNIDDPRAVVDAGSPHVEQYVTSFPNFPRRGRERRKTKGWMG